MAREGGASDGDRTAGVGQEERRADASVTGRDRSAQEDRGVGAESPGDAKWSGLSVAVFARDWTSAADAVWDEAEPAAGHQMASGADRGGDGLFRGTAWHYARFRPGCPDALLDLLVERFGLDGDGRLLDVGCGTGQLSLPLAGYVREVVGMDP